MAEKKLPFEVEITAVDKISAPLDRLSDKLEKLQAPAKKFGAAFSRLGEASGIGRVTDAIKGVGDAAGQVLGRFAAVAGGAAVAAGGVFALVKSSADFGDRIDELATKAGVGVEAFQELAYAASFSSIDQEQLGTTLAKLNKNIGQATLGNKEMTAWFKRAGLSVADLKTMKPEQVFARISDAIAEIPADSPKRAALAMALLGKSGADMIPMLADGSAKLREQAEEARRLGVIMGEDAVKASVSFNDQFDRTMKSVQGVGRMIGGVLMPVIQPMLVAMQDWIVKNRDLIKGKVVEWAEKFAAQLPTIIDGVKSLGDGLLSFINVVGKVVDMMGGVQNALIAVAVVMSGPLILAVTQLGIALMATPVGWVIGGLAAVAAAGWLLYSNWTEIWTGISDVVGGSIESIVIWWDQLYASAVSIWDSMIGYIMGKVAQLTGLVPDWLKGLFGGGDVAVNTTAAPTQTAKSLGPTAGQQGGQASVVVDFKNMPPGTSVKPAQNNGVPLDLGMGYAMPGAY